VGCHRSHSKEKKKIRQEKPVNEQGNQGGVSDQKLRWWRAKQAHVLGRGRESGGCGGAPKRRKEAATSHRGS